jgi:antitoxin component YwqK of YwqJK toxin-antitoxin module
VVCKKYTTSKKLINMIVDINDPNLFAFDDDVNGDLMYKYNGTLFTGIIRAYYESPKNTSQVELETSYVNGEIWGVQTSWHDNGQMRCQMHFGLGRIDGLWQNWDKQGNLTYSKMWIKGVEQSDNNKLIVLEDDPNLNEVDCDFDGCPVYEYNGSPFTGFVKCFFYNSTSVEGEYEYQNGYRLGLQTCYYSNGQKDREYTLGDGGFDGVYKRWDEQGNLLSSETWVNGHRL